MTTKHKTVNNTICPACEQPCMVDYVGERYTLHSPANKELVKLTGYIPVSSCCQAEIKE